MFIERSAGRIRLVRTIFLDAGVLPSLVLAGWAVHRRSAGHREAVRLAWQRSVGLPLGIGSLTHPRPGVVVASACDVRSPAGRVLLRLPDVEVETAASEDRIRIAGVRIDADSAALLGDLARDWLRGVARHPRNCLVEVAEVEWPGVDRDAASTPGAAACRVECVARDGVRAIRVARGGDEVRVVRSIAGTGDSVAERFEIAARVETPVPAAVLAAAAGWHEAAVALLGGGMVAGMLDAVCSGTDAGGSASGRIDGVDLARCCAAVGGRGAGSARIDVRRLEWRDGRLFDVDMTCGAGPGWIDSTLVDRLVTTVGCLPGPAAREPRERRGFDSLGLALSLDGAAVRVRPVAADAIATADGEVLLAPPRGPVGFDRLAWMVSPPASTFVPARGPGGWLMSVEPAAASPRPDGRSGRGDGRRF